MATGGSDLQRARIPTIFKKKDPHAKHIYPNYFFIIIKKICYSLDNVAEMCRGCVYLTISTLFIFVCSKTAHLKPFCLSRRVSAERPDADIFRMESQIADLCTSGQCFHILPQACQRFSKALHAEVGKTLKTPIARQVSQVVLLICDHCLYHQMETTQLAVLFDQYQYDWNKAVRPAPARRKRGGRWEVERWWEDVLRLRRAY